MSENESKCPDFYNDGIELRIKYLNYLNYNFNDSSKEKSGYVIFKDKKIVFTMDIGNSPDFKYSKKYQSGCLSFEITSNGEKLICNSGFDINKNTGSNDKTIDLHGYTLDKANKLVHNSILYCYQNNIKPHFHDGAARDVMLSKRSTDTYTSLRYHQRLPAVRVIDDDHPHCHACSL